MRRLLTCNLRWLAAWYLLLLPPSADAGVLSGRVVDSAGRPIAGAEVRIWQKLPDAKVVVADQQVKFDGREALTTDADGRFATPDVLVAEAFARVVVEANGRLAGRSGWIEIGKDTEAVAPDIVLKRLRGVIGQVLDRKNQPVAGATVFDSGDGNERVETKTGRGGKFFLDGVPEGPVVLFAEKPGYRFTGLRLSADEPTATFVLATIEEPVEPIATLEPLVSDEDEAAIARKLIDAWLDEAVKSGDDASQPLSALADLDPLEAYNRLIETPIILAPNRGRLQASMLGKCITRRVLPWDELRTLIETLDDRRSVGRMYMSAALRMGHAEAARRREWLAEALLSARSIDEPAARVQFLAGVAQGLFDAGDEQRAIEIVSEAEKIAEQFPPIERYRFAFFFLASALAKHDPVRALAWIDKITDPNFVIDGTVFVVKLLPEHPAAAEDLWNRTRDRMERGRPAQLASRGNHIAEFCYEMAHVDLPRAERMAREAADHPLRVRGLGAVALRLAESDPTAARKLLEEIIRDELPRANVGDDFKPFDSLLAPAITATWLLPIAERIDPQLGRECLWRSLALRPPRSRRDKFDDEDAAIDIALAMMLSRYDRDLARMLLEPQVARLPELARCGSTGRESPHARAAYARASTETGTVLAAALSIDAHWAAELYAGLPNGNGESERRFQAWIRHDWAYALSQRTSGRWGRPGRFSFFAANYWEPVVEKALKD